MSEKDKRLGWRRTMKMFMTHFLAAILGICFVLNFAACGKSQQVSSSHPEPEESETSQNVEWVVKNQETAAMMEQATGTRALESFKYYLTTLDKEHAELILDDPQMVYMMLLDTYWFQPAVTRFRGDYPGKNYSVIQIKDAFDNDISSDVIDLWFAANEVYNVDDTGMFEMGSGVSLFEQAPEYYELKNYDAVIDFIFTANGRKQVEETRIGSEKTFIQKRDGKTYRLGPWKTGYSVAAALSDIQPKEVNDSKIVVTVKYKKSDGPMDGMTENDDMPEYVLVDFTIVKEDGIWKVDDYIYPEERS